MRGAEPLPERMISHQFAELTGQQAVLAQRQPGFSLLFQRDQPLLLQPRDRRLSKHGVGEVRQRRSSPQGQRIGKQPGPVPKILGRTGPLDQGCEPALVKRAALDPQQIARRAEYHQLTAARLGVLQRLPQPADLQLQGAGGMGGKVIAPQIVDQPVRRHWPPEVDEEIGQQGAHLGLGDLDELAVLCPRCQGAEQPETH